MNFKVVNLVVIVALAVKIGALLKAAIMTNAN